MNRQALIAAYRVGFGLLTVIAIVVQLADLAGRGVLNPVNFFSYFTIQSNLIGVAVFLLGASRWRRGSTGFDLVRGASVHYLMVTFVVFALSCPAPTSIPPSPGSTRSSTRSSRSWSSPTG